MAVLKFDYSPNQGNLKIIIWTENIKIAYHSIFIYRIFYLQHYIAS